MIAVAIRKHEGGSNNLLDFRPGEKIIIDESRKREDSWVYGSIGATREGWFPSEFVIVEEHFV